MSMKKRECFCLLAGVFALLVLGDAASGEDTRSALTVGTLETQESLPFDKLARDSTLSFNPSPVAQKRSLAFPWLSPLPDAINLHPDVICALVGYHYSDLPALAEKGIIEPLDPLFRELGIDPKAYFLPNVYQAVEWEGHVWAVPHRAETFVYSLDKAVFNKLGLSTELKTWSEFVTVLERIAASDVIQGKKVTFNSWSLSIDLIASLCLGFADAAREGSVSRQAADTLFARCATSKGFQEQGERQSAAIYLNSLSTVTQTKWVCLAQVPAPSAIDAPGEKGHTLGFLECYALRKNSPEKRKAVMDFLRWLLKEETQLALVEASRLDLPAAQMRMKHHHIPLSTPVLSSAGFDAICNTLPAYRLLAASIADIGLTPPAQGRNSQLQKVGYNWMEQAVWTGNVGDIFGALPKLVQELDAAEKNSAATATAGGGLDKY